jgi:DNA modification methylase
MGMSNPMSEWKFKRDTAFRKQFFVPDSFAHPAKMDAQLLIRIVETYTELGETILDPMAGSGTTMLACTLGRNVILVELEEKFIRMCRDNWEQVRMRPQLGYTMGECVIMQGDARQLENILCDKIITSPPYAGVEDTHEVGDFHLKRKSIGKNNVWVKRGQLEGLLVDKIVTSPPFAGSRAAMADDYTGFNFGDAPNGKPKTYGDAEGQIGNLPYGAIDKIVTSPPYAETLSKHAGGDMNLHYDGKKTCDMTREERQQRKADSIYSDNEENISNLPYGEIDKIITSPPYEASVEPTREGTSRGIRTRMYAEGKTPPACDYGVERGQIGNLKSDTYLQAMLQVYRSCFSVLKSGGLMILVTKNFIRNKQIVRLDLDTIKLCEQAGFSFVKRHYRKLPSQSFWRIIYYQKHPDVPVIDKEDILVFRK